MVLPYLRPLHSRSDRSKVEEFKGERLIVPVERPCPARVSPWFVLLVISV